MQPSLSYLLHISLLPLLRTYSCYTSTPSMKKKLNLEENTGLDRMYGPDLYNGKMQCNAD